MGTSHPLNSGWKYIADFKGQYLEPGFDIGPWEDVCLPHANREIPYSGFDEACFQFVSTYARDLEASSLSGRRVFLDSGAVMCACELWLNGSRVGSHSGGYTPFSVELTDALDRGGRNRLVIRVDSTERPDIPPFGYVVDYLCYGGIYRELGLRLQDDAYIADLWARPGRVLEDPKELRVELRLDSRVGLGGARLSCRLERGGVALAERGLELSEAGGSHSILLDKLRDIELWEPDSPVLYRVTAVLELDGRILDRSSRDIGFRAAEFRPEGFFLNGKRLPLRGLNRHQSFPYVGYAMPARAQARDADILKRELGVNIVRTSHYPQSTHFLDRCDRIGLLVFEELPGWQHIGDSGWKDIACMSLEEMILRDRSRPSVVLWGVRVNESQDDHDFYLRSNAIAHRLDPDRQTGGVRYIKRGEALEDVYTFNDFSHSGGRLALQAPRAVVGTRMPYLVTEHNGHMYPTKAIDGEERHLEHALRHARVLDAAGRVAGISGAIGWCAFDYNTHKDFGSGDRICHHGVATMFRQPKFAAWAYSSQMDPRERVVLEAASFFAKGERCAAKLLPIQVYTNCDSVVLFRGGARVGRYFPAKKEFPGLVHPPVIIRDLVGETLAPEGYGRFDQATFRRVARRVFSDGLASLPWYEYLFIGLLLLKRRIGVAEFQRLMSTYGIGWGKRDDTFELVGYLGEKEAIRRSYGSGSVPTRLVLEPDDLALSCGDWDTTRVCLRLLDQYGNLCPFVPEAVKIEIEGPARIIGPSLLSVLGGQTAFWIRTEGRVGDIKLRACGARFTADCPVIRVSSSPLDT
jgi:beta-galactosidase